MKTGYIMLARGYHNADKDKEWMRSFGCTEIIEEQQEHEILRPEWQKLRKRLKRGDTLVVARFSNVLRESVRLNFMLDNCYNNGIRIISINDRIDTEGELFQETTSRDVLRMLSRLPKAILAERGKADVAKLKIEKMKVFSSTLQARAERKKLIVNMYNNGFSIDDIWKASAFRSRSSVFRILNEAGVSLDRGKTRGPLGPRKKN